MSILDILLFYFLDSEFQPIHYGLVLDLLAVSLFHIYLILLYLLYPSLFLYIIAPIQLLINLNQLIDLSTNLLILLQYCIMFMLTPLYEHV